MEKMMQFDEKRNLIVNYLPGSLTQEDVKNLFSQIGPVSNCKLIRSYETGQSLGYAFIEYPSEHMTLEAINKLDGTKMDDKILKVSYARQSSPDIKNSNVYIAGLPGNVTEDVLYSLFSPFGKVITHKLLTNPDNTSRGVGFVRYSLKSEAQAAIECMGGKVLEGGKTALTVKLAIPPVSKQQNHLLASSSQINAMAGVTGVGSIRGSVRFNPLAPSNQAITNTVQVPVLSAINAYESQILHNPSNAALMQYKADSSSLLQNLQNTGPAGSSISTSQAFSVYIFGLQAHHSELHLYELFAPFGAILNVKLIRDLKKEDKPSKGYGFVNFRKHDEAHLAVDALNNRILEGKVLQVSFKKDNQRCTHFQQQSQTTHLTSHTMHFQQQQLPLSTNVTAQMTSPVFSNFHLKYPN